MTYSLIDPELDKTTPRDFTLSFLKLFTQVITRGIMPTKFNNFGLFKNDFEVMQLTAFLEDIHWFSETTGGWAE